MNQILMRPLWVGHAGESGDVRRVLELGVEAVVHLAVEDLPCLDPRGLIACRFPLVDGAGNRPELLVMAVRTVASLIASDVPTLVCCGAGLSRAPAVTAAALTVAEGGAPGTWLGQVTYHHPSDVSPGLWSELVAILPRVRTLTPSADRADARSAPVP
jgi:hypothetical protein